MYSYYSKVLGSIGIGFIDSLRINQHVMYGVEQHFKNPCDGYFAELNFRKRMAKQEHMITSISELVGHFERLGAEARALDPDKDAETFFEFTPPQKETVKELCLRPNSLPSLIQGCHCWEFIFEDRRRVSLYGRYDKEDVTAVQCRARMRCGTPRRSAAVGRRAGRAVPTMATPRCHVPAHVGAPGALSRRGGAALRGRRPEGGVGASSSSPTRLRRRRRTGAEPGRDDDDDDEAAAAAATE